MISGPVIGNSFDPMGLTPQYNMRTFILYINESACTCLLNKAECCRALFDKITRDIHNRTKKCVVYVLFIIAKFT